MTKLQHYLSMVVFTLGFVLGVQVPHFVDQYAKRVDAHLQEANEHLQGYQAIADVNQGGSIESLIRKHASSSDATFRDEASVIQRVYDNQARYERQQQALQGPLIERLRHIALDGDPRILKQTYQQYGVAIPWTSDAIVCGFVMAIALSLLLELTLGLLSAMLGGLMWRRRSKQLPSRYSGR